MLTAMLTSPAAWSFAAGLLLGTLVTMHVMGDWHACRAQHYAVTCVVMAW